MKTMLTKPSIIDTSGFTADPLQVAGKSVLTHVGMVNQVVLRFFPDNPRVYSIVHEEGKTPTQDDIQSKLQEMEHVRALIQDIKKHGGLIDPLVVKDGSMEVVEGNSRLAAYRVLFDQAPTKWAMVKVRVLPADIDERIIASLLGQWHLRGKKEWPPYEQAGYLFRRHRQQKVPLSTLAAEAGETTTRIERIIEAYELMVEQKDTKRERWSYYDEFVKSRKIAKVAERHDGFRNRVLDMVKKGEFDRAQDLRDKLPIICDGPAKTINKFADGKLTFDQALEAAKEGGGDNAPLQRVHKFRLWLAKQAVQDALAEADGEAREKIEFELKKLGALLAGLQKKM